MAKNQYHSDFTDRLLSPAQYITELVCRKKANLDNVELVYKFWNTDKWKKYYKYQIIVANRLLGLFSAKAIILALNSKEAYRIYSLSAAYLKVLIKNKEEQLKTNKMVLVAAGRNKNDDIFDPKKIDITEIPRRDFKKKNPLEDL